MIEFITNLFKKRSVDTILSSHTKTIKALSAHSDKQGDRANQIGDEIKALEVAQLAALTESTRAAKISRRMMAAIEE